MSGLLSIFTGSYLFCAIFGGTLFLLTTALSVFGGDADGSDGDIGSVSFFSIKSILAFITFYGLGGLCFAQYGWGGFAVSVVCGLLMMTVVTFLIAFIFKLQHSGNIKSEDVVGSCGTVYLSIPGSRQHGGQVSVTLSGSTMIVSAVADEPIETGTPVTVVKDLGNNIFEVEKIK